MQAEKQEALDKAKDELINLHRGNVVGISCDVRNYDEVENTLKKIKEQFGQLDILVNNAAEIFYFSNRKTFSQSVQYNT